MFLCRFPRSGEFLHDVGVWEENGGNDGAAKTERSAITLTDAKTHRHTDRINAATLIFFKKAREEMAGNECCQTQKIFV